MSRKAPAFTFYPDRFMGGTVEMTDAQVGLYIRLLCLQWQCDGISDRIASKVADGCTPADIRLVLDSKFVKEDDGRYRNQRLEEQRSKAKDISKINSENAKKRWEKQGNKQSPECDRISEGSSVGICDGTSDRISDGTANAMPSNSNSNSNSNSVSKNISKAAPSQGDEATRCRLRLIELWNKASKLMSVKQHKDGKTLQANFKAAWNCSERGPIVREPEQITAAAIGAKFGHGKPWFNLNDLLKSKNSNKSEYKLVMLIDGRYDSDPKDPPSAMDSFKERL